LSTFRFTVDAYYGIINEADVKLMEVRPRSSSSSRRPF